MNATWRARNVSSRRGLGIAGLLAALWLTGCASARQAEVQRLQAQAAYERGLGHYAEAQGALALEALREAIALDPTVAAYHNWLGRLYMELRRPDLAVEHFREATRLEPGYSDAWVNLGVVLDEIGRWDEAVASYRKALALPILTAPHLAYNGLGLVLFHLKRWREAEEALRFAISLNPAMEGSYYNLGLVLLAQERREDARLAFRRARELAPQSPFGRAATGQLQALGDGG
jgi:tetratricopeptide (TPR) repeat protein